MFLNQRKYTFELLDDMGLLNRKHTSTLILPNLKVTKRRWHSVSESQSKLYQRLIGRLLHLTNTRPDLALFVSKLSQYVSNPMQSHYSVATWILQYTKTCPGKGLFFSSSFALLPGNIITPLYCHHHFQIQIRRMLLLILIN